MISCWNLISIKIWNLSVLTESLFRTNFSRIFSIDSMFVLEVSKSLRAIIPRKIVLPNSKIKSYCLLDQYFISSKDFKIYRFRSRHNHSPITSTLIFGGSWLLREDFETFLKLKAKKRNSACLVILIPLNVPLVFFRAEKNICI